MDTYSIERNKDGLVTTPDGSIYIPKNQSMLSYLSDSQVSDGDDFVSEPYWIVNRKTGSRRKKIQTISTNSFTHELRLWSGKLDPSYIQIAEQKYYDIKERLEPRAKEILENAIARVEKVGGVAHFIDQNQDLGTISYHIHVNGEGQKSFEQK